MSPVPCIDVNPEKPHCGRILDEIHTYRSARYPRPRALALTLTLVLSLSPSCFRSHPRALALTLVLSLSPSCSRSHPRPRALALTLALVLSLSPSCSRSHLRPRALALTSSSGSGASRMAVLFQQSTLSRGQPSISFSTGRDAVPPPLIRTFERSSTSRRG